MAISFLVNKTASAELNARPSAKCTDKKLSLSASSTLRYFTTSPQVVKFLLNNYATYEVIVETGSDIMRFVQPSGVIPTQYAEELMTNTLRCEDVHENYSLNKIIIKGLNASIRHSMREYWGREKEANLNALHSLPRLCLCCRDMT